MKISILGTGSVGVTLAQGFSEAGHEVLVGTRDVEETLERAADVPEAAWLVENPLKVKTFGDAAAAGELLVNATNGAASLEALSAAGADNLAGKVLIDVANPLDFSHGFPPSLLVKDTDSLGEQIQRSFPEVRVVKSLNTMNAGLMLNPGKLSGGSAVFLSGEDASAKQVVHDLLAGFGWEQIIDLGGIQTSRGAEMLLPMWLQLMGFYGSPEFNWSVVR